MSGMNLKQIIDKLNTEFTGEVRKLVFWYDAAAEFVDDLEEIEQSLTNAKVLRLEKDNQFHIKYFLECEDKTTNYLVYASFAKPSIRENHLADTILYSKEFYADRASLLALNLGIKDERSIDFIKQHLKFFASKERSQKFDELDIVTYNERTMAIAIMSVLCKNKVSSFEEVLRCVLTEDGLEENQYLAEFAKYDVLDMFWTLVENYLGYNDENPTLVKLVNTLFITYAAKTIACDIPNAWEAYISYKPGSVIAFLDNLMNNYLYSEKYDDLAHQAFVTINGMQYMGGMEIEAIAKCNVFAEVDELLLKWIIGRLENEDIGAKVNGMNIAQLCLERRKQHFGRQYKKEYFTLENAFYVIANSNYENIQGIENLVREYTDKLYQIDTRYRYFYYYYDQIEDNGDYEKVKELVERIYTNEYLNKITVNWNKELAKADFNTGLKLQRNFFRDCIEQAQDRIAVIISDAFRYEAAHTLYENLVDDEKCTAILNVVQSVLPSYTPLGMASLLPHTKLAYNDNYDVLVDGQPCVTTLQREAILQKVKTDSRCIQFDTIKNMKQAELREIFTGQDVVYIYHNQVDARGDAAKTENEVFTACEEAIQEIHALVRRLSSQANTHHCIITADHGFIYKRNRLNENDKISSSVLSNAHLGQRYAVMDVPVDELGVGSVSLDTVLGQEGTGKVVSFPLGTDIFKAPGAGQNYIHGGSSPQETLVPVIDVKIDRNRKETTPVKIELISMLNKITNLNINLDFIQREPVGDIFKETTYKIYFIDSNNEKISNDNICKADKKDLDSSKRIFRYKFSFKNQEYDNSKKHYLVIYDMKNEMELLRQEVVVDMAFAGDFGFFS